MSIKFGNYTYKENERFGDGGYGAVYLARKEGESEGAKRLYVIKIPNEKRMNEQKILSFNNEIDILSKLSQIPNNFYTSLLYDFRKFENVPGVKPYLIMDYFSKGLLLDYASSGHLSERHIKYIFKKVIQSYQFLHKNGIFHLDAKPDNIILDNEIRPIIIDFGLSEIAIKENTNKIFIKGDVPSTPYSAPELKTGKEIDGEKADVFSLGAILFNLVNGRLGFCSAKRHDQYYKFIMKKEYQRYWNNITKKDLSEDFKNLYLSMVAYNPDKRPTLVQILNSDWLKEVSKLTEDEEAKIKKELEDIHNEIKNLEEKKIEQKIKDENLITRSSGNDEDKIFTDKNLKPKKISNDRLILNQSIKINGNFSEVDFMNSLYRDIKNKFEKNCYVEALENLSMKVDFEYEQEEEKEEKEEENEDNGEEKEPIADCQMMIELFEYEKGKYLLEFRRSGGSYADYYHHFLKIKEIITKKDY